MAKEKLNGNGKVKSGAELEGKEIEFPVTFHFKAVMIGTENEDDNKQRLVKVFNNNKVDYKFLDKKVSSKGSYISFTYEIVLTDRQQMDKMYAELKQIKELKFAL